MVTGRRSWAPAWWAAVGMLLVPLAALLWLTPAAAPLGPPHEPERGEEPSPPSAREPAEPRESDPLATATRSRRPPAPSDSDEPAVAVAGQVLGPNGQTLAGALVSCEDREPDDKPLKVVTGPDGEFSLPLEADGCSAVATHRQLGESAAVQLHAGGRNQLELQSGAVIEGIVVDERGQFVDPYVIAIESYVPAGGPLAAQRRGAHARGGESQQVSGASGAFVFKGLLPGRYVLAASAAGRPPVHSDGIELGPGERTQTVRIQLGLGGALEGRILDRDTGEAIAGAQVTLDGFTMTGANAIQPARSEADGNYRLEGVPATPFSVRVNAAGYRSQVVAGLRAEGGRALTMDLPLVALADGGHNETEYTGIGAALASTIAGVIVAEALDGGPAAAAGVQRKDRIVAIDGRSTEGLSVAQCVQLLRGPEGSRVALSLERESGGALEVVLTRARFVH